MGRTAVPAVPGAACDQQGLAAGLGLAARLSQLTAADTTGTRPSRTSSCRTGGASGSPAAPLRRITGASYPDDRPPECSERPRTPLQRSVGGRSQPPCLCTSPIQGGRIPPRPTRREAFVPCSLAS